MQSERRKNNLFTIGITVLSAALVGWFVCNTVLFTNMLDWLAKRYVLESNRQLTEHISYRLKTSREFVSDFAETLERMPEFLMTEELLERKRAAFELEDLIVVSEEKIVHSGTSDISFLEDWVQRHENVWEEPAICYEKDRCIIFAAPVVKNGQTKELVIGMQSYRDLQLLVSSADYEGQGISILLDPKEEPIIMEGNTDLVIQEKKIKNFLKVIEKMDKGEVSRYELENFGDVFVTIGDVEETNWKQIAVIPANFFLNRIELYLQIYIMIGVGVFMIICALLFRYVRENKKKEKAFFMDALTQQYNREGFLKESRRILDGEVRTDYVLAYLNVVDFRYINESWGEEDGNHTLRFIAKTLAEELREEELICRNGMDHFFLLLHEQEDGKVIQRISFAVQRMNHIVEQKFRGYGIEFTIGACRLKENRKTSAMMNKAIYASKVGKEKNTCTFYEGEIEDQFNREHWLNNVFDEAVKNREFEVYLQPKVDLKDKGRIRAEALVRWINPKEGFICPADFIPLFEQNGKISILDMYMFEEVCSLVDKWYRAGENIEVSVNLSRYHLRNSGTNVCREYQRIKEKYKIPDGLIEIELTETGLLEENQLSFVKTILEGFHSCGLKVALDDFGFAYSSLAMLKDFEVDDLKLDRTFFVNENEKSKKIVANVIHLAHDLGVSVVAEGIEEMEQVETLRELGCDMVQGYVYSKPVPVDEFEVWRKRHAK